MPVEIREYFIVAAIPAKPVGPAYLPYDVKTKTTHSLLKLPQRAKYGSDMQAQLACNVATVAARLTATELMGPHPCAYSADTMARIAESAEWYNTVEFKVAKVAITVDLLPQ